MQNFKKLNQSLLTEVSFEDSLQLFAVCAQIVKTDLTQTKNILDLPQSEIVNYIEEYVHRNQMQWFNLHIPKISQVFLREIFFFFIEMKNEIDDEHSYGMEVLNLLQELLFTHTNYKSSEYMASKNIVNLFKDIVEDASNKVLYDGACGLGTIAHSLGAKKNILRDINARTLGLAETLFSFTEQDVSFALQNTLQNDEQSHQADIVICTPPFGVRVSEILVEHNAYLKQFFIKARIPSSGSDSLWIQQALYQLNDTGKAYLVLSTGWLFRGGYDALLREQLIERDLVESVILLPAGMWNSMNIETCVLILNKSKQMKGIRMLDARGFGQRKAARLTLTTDDSAQIKCLMLGLKEDETISKLVSIQEVKEKNYSLHCAEYFTAAINIEEVDLQQELQILKDVQQQYYKAQERFNALVKTTTSTENT